MLEEPCICSRSYRAPASTVYIFNGDSKPGGLLHGIPEHLKDALPDYAKDIRLNIDSAIARSTLENTEAVGVALACAFSAHCRVIVAAIRNAGVLSAEEQNGALT